ncbi:rod-binding protein [Geomonas sp. RF6]|uniref:rod-binding protein n=1 Tax=Geomonas sp. RF6 TaxID=2897342 RepID=UPI001E5D9D4B|nr:rod-binding protein [Geomonas sp. RF6]UFS72406.1 rod-binding protein [Geomonas sp. RF6]
MEIKAAAIPASALPVAELKVPKTLKSAPEPTDKEKAAMKKVAHEFESMFVAMMLKSMRQTVGEDKLTGGGHGEETYRSLLDEEYAAQAAKSGTIGLAAAIEKQLAQGLVTPRNKDRADR